MRLFSSSTCVRTAVIAFGISRVRFFTECIKGRLRPTPGTLLVLNHALQSEMSSIKNQDFNVIEFAKWEFGVDTEGLYKAGLIYIDPNSGAGLKNEDRENMDEYSKQLIEKGRNNSLEENEAILKELRDQEKKAWALTRKRLEEAVVAQAVADTLNDAKRGIKFLVKCQMEDKRKEKRAKTSN